MYAEVAPATPLFGKNQVYTYQIDQVLTEGTVVSIPFGKRSVQGVVIAATTKPPYPTKQVSRVYPAKLTPQQLALAARIAGYAGGGLGYTLRLFFPPSRSIPKPKKKKRGVQTLIIIPERWMTKQFPNAEIYHAGLGTKERSRIWSKVASGEAVTIVGTQKAFFLPWHNLTSITLHEAQLPTHKLWDQYPRLDNRRFARFVVDIYGCTLREDASFPSVALWHTNHKKYLSKAKLRYSIVPFSVDDRRKKFLLPQKLVHDIYVWMKKKETVLILHNEKKSSVRAAMKLLRLSRKYVSVDTTAVFTRVEDTMFDHVVWMYPERIFSFPDVHSREDGVLLLARLQQFLKIHQHVILVTRHPEYIQRQVSGSGTAVLKEILQERKQYSYPPYSDMVRLVFEDTSEKKVEKIASVARTLLNTKVVDKKVRIRGPYPPLRRRTRSSPHTRYILLTGDLTTLSRAYQGIRATAIDIDPHTVL